MTNKQLSRHITNIFSLICFTFCLIAYFLPITIFGHRAFWLFLAGYEAAILVRVLAQLVANTDPR